MTPSPEPVGGPGPWVSIRQQNNSGCSLLPLVAGLCHCLKGQTGPCVTGSSQGSFRPRLGLSQVQGVFNKFCPSTCLTGPAPLFRMDIWHSVLASVWVHFLPDLAVPLGSTISTFMCDALSNITGGIAESFCYFQY